jgi:hypothetical protein
MMTNGPLVGTNGSQVHTTSIFGVEYGRCPYKRRKPSYLTAKCHNPETTQSKYLQVMGSEVLTCTRATEDGGSFDLQTPSWSPISK